MNRRTPPEHRLIDYALALTAAELDPVDRQRVADIVFDNLGIAIGAYVARQSSGLICEDYMLERGAARGDSGASLWSGRGTLPPDEAALCNGTWAEILDYQDTVVDPRNNGHAAVTIVPAALAVAEARGASGAELIAAVAAGLEVTIAVLRAVGRGHRAEGRGFRTTSIGAPLGAAVACAKLLGLDRAQALNAMGIAGACANNGLMPSLSPSNGDFGMDKDWVNGLSAQLAVNAAGLAARGMTASDAVVTGDRGILASHAHGDAHALKTPEGGAPNIRFVALKKYAACYGVHTAMEATMNLMARHDIEPAAIDGITVRVKADSCQTLAGRTIGNHMAARFSLPYSVASAAIRGAARMADFDAPAIFDADVLAFMERVALLPDPALTRFHEETGGFPAHVEIRSGGRAQDERIDYPVGSHERPMSRAELEAKFAELTARHWPEARRAEILAAAADLAALDDIRALTRLF